MAACEKCWTDAYVRVMTLGGSQVDHYYALLQERDRDGKTCTPEQQASIEEIDAALESKGE